MDIHFSKGILFLQWINFASLWTFSCQFVGWCISLLYSLDLFLDFDYIYTLRNCSFKRNLSNQAFLFLQLCSWYSLYYHVHFRIRLSISAKRLMGLLTWMALTMDQFVHMWQVLQIEPSTNEQIVFLHSSVYHFRYSLSNILKYLMYRLNISFVRFIPKYYIIHAVFNSYAFIKF
jgi:hypothetical protein